MDSDTGSKVVSKSLDLNDLLMSLLAYSDDETLNCRNDCDRLFPLIPKDGRSDKAATLGAADSGISRKQDSSLPLIVLYIIISTIEVRKMQTHIGTKKKAILKERFVDVDHV